jgi:hypothetical protein
MQSAAVQDAALYWQWRPCFGGHEQYWGTIVGAHGQPRPLYSEVAQIGVELEAAAPLLASTSPHGDLAILYSMMIVGVSRTTVTTRDSIHSRICTCTTVRYAARAMPSTLWNRPHNWTVTRLCSHRAFIWSGTRRHNRSLIMSPLAAT